MTPIRPVNGLERLGTLAVIAVIAATCQLVPDVVVPAAANGDVPPAADANQADLR